MNEQPMLRQPAGMVGATVKAKMAEVLDVLTVDPGEEAVACCSHVLSGQTGDAGVCADHPWLGVLCAVCVMAHAAEHSLDRPICSACERRAPLRATWHEVTVESVIVETSEGVSTTLDDGLAVLLVLCDTCLVEGFEDSLEQWQDWQSERGFRR